MTRTPRDVTDTELKVLQVLWRDMPLTIRRITDQLYEGGNASHYATVQKLLERLEAKGYVARKTSGRVRLFTATVDREGLIGQQLQATADKLCEGSLTPLLTHLVQEASLSSEDMRAIKNLVDELGKKKRKCS